jgi:tetratricopeptide (TPR) repeat protein
MGLYESDILPHGRETASKSLAHDLVSYGLLVQMKGRYDDAMTAFDEAIALSDAAGDAWGSVRSRISAARVAIFLGRRADMLRLLEDAMSRSQEAAMENHYARTLVLYGYALASGDRDRVEEGLAHLHKGIAILQRINNLAELLDAYNNMGNLHLHAGRFGRALEAFTAYAELCDRLGHRTEAVFAQLNLGAVRLELGELAAARAHAARGVAMARESKRRFPEGFGLALEGLVQVLEGQATAGVEAIASGVAIARDLKNKYLELNLLPYEAEAQVHLGGWSLAAAALASARTLATETGNAELEARLTRLEAAVAVGTGDSGAAERLDALERVTAEAPGETAHLERWRGEWHYRAGRAADAAAAFSRALARADEDGLALVAVEAGYRLAQLTHEAGETDRARALYEAAFSRAREAGYVLYELLSALAVGKLDPRRSDLREEPRRRLRAMWEALSPDAQAGFSSWPERRAALAAEPGVSSRQGRLVERMIEVVSSPDPDWVMQRAVEAFVELTGVERGFLLLFEGFEVTRMATSGAGDAEPDEYSTSLAYRVLWSGEPLLIEDVSTDQELANQASVQALGLRSAVGVPVLHDGRPIGVLMGDSKGLIPDFGVAELDLAMAFAQFTGEAITGAERSQRFRQGYEEHRVLHRVAMVGLQARSLDLFMAAVAREVLALTGAERMVLLTGADLKPQLAYSGPDATPSTRTEVSSSVASWVAEHQEPLFLIDAQSDDSFRASQSVQALGLRTVMAVPVGRAEGWRCVIYVDTQRVGRQDDRMLHTLAQIGEMVAAFMARES